MTTITTRRFLQTTGLLFAGVLLAACGKKAPEAAAPAAMLVAPSIQVIVFVCVAATIWLGLYPSNIIDWVNRASRDLLALML